MSLLDLAASFRPEDATVLLFRDGPFRIRLEERGVTVRVAAGADAFVTLPRGSGLLSLMRGIGGLSTLVRQAVRLAGNHTVIHANTQKALLVGALAARLSRRPLVWHLRDILTAEDTSRTVRRVARLFANHFVDLVIANSAATRQGFTDIGGRAPSVTIHNGIDPARFGSSAAVPRPPDIPRGAPLIGLFGRLAEWKGQHVAIEALAEVDRAHLLLVGGPLFGQQAYEARLRALTDLRGLAGRVHFLGHREDVAGWMRACDLILHSSIFAEPFGRVVVEAMLSEKPVIATNAGGIREIVTDGVTGLLVPPGNAEAMARALRRLISDPVLAASVASAGREQAMLRFSLGGYTHAVHRALEGVIAGRRQVSA